MRQLICGLVLVLLPTMAFAQSANTCLAELQSIARAEPTASPVAEDPACMIPDPVSLTSVIGTVPVELPNVPVLDCPFALTFAKFIRDRAAPLAEFHLATQLRQISTGPGFTCRRRNNRPTGKLSEHAFGNGIDITSFSFSDGSSLRVQFPDAMAQSQAGFFLETRQQSCTYFTTVLGPGSNEAHASHLHFDLGRSAGTNNPYRICE